MKSKKVSFYGILGALSLTLSFFESVLLPEIPFLPPGAKPGLSNLVTMYAAFSGGFAGGFYIVALKALFALATRGVTAGLMSFCGGFLSLVTVCLLIKKEEKYFSFFGIGVASAVMHNLGQLLAACVITGTPGLLNYGKYLMIFALITGSVTGLVLLLLMPRLKKINSFFTINQTEKQ